MPETMNEFVSSLPKRVKHFVSIKRINGKLKVEPDALAVGTNEQVVWRSEVGKFRVEFCNASPFDVGAIESLDTQLDEEFPDHPPAVIQASQTGRFKYDVVVTNADGEIERLDPFIDVIIKE